MTVIRPWVDTEAGQAIPDGEAVVYCDISRVAAVASLLKPWQVIAFNCYPNPGEFSADFDARIHEAISRVIPDKYILVAGAWNRGTLTDQEVLDGLSVVYQNATRIMCLGVAIFGLDRGTSIGQFKPLYQQCADLYLAPQGRPDFPVQPVVPIPVPPEDPVKMFANDQEKKDYCNRLAVSVAVRRNEALGTIGSNGILDPQGQKVWQAMDQWNAVQTPGSIPPADVMLDLTLDTYGPMTGEQLQAILRYQEPLR